MIIELRPSRVFAEVLVPAPALEVYKLISSKGTQKNIQLRDKEDASNVDAANALIRFDTPTGPSITLFFANRATTFMLFELV